MKRIINFAIAAILVMAATILVGCQKETTTEKVLTKENIKIGLITLHDQESTYDGNFIASMYRALENLGIAESQLELVTGIGEDSNCLDAANSLAQTCDFVFADSFGHEDYIIQAAKKNPNVFFGHATGTQAHTANIANFGNAFAAIYEGRYAAGVAAGMKLNEMINAGTITAEQAVMGYVGAYPYEEVVSGYTSFYLGAKSVCPSVTMKVRFTSTWYDYDLEYAAANSLIDTDNCVLISQHADSMGAPTACNEKNVPNVTYNGTTVAACPNTYIVSSKIDWAPYFEYVVNSLIAGTEIAKDWTGTFATGSVVLDPVGSSAAEGTQAAIDDVIAQFKAGTLHAFDCSTFTVGGETLTSAMANVDTDPAYTPDTEAISNGYFHESEYRSAPYFGLLIDGITQINDAE